MRSAELNGGYHLRTTSELKINPARLLLALLLNGPRMCAKDEELMEAAGITDRDTFTAARKQLSDARLITLSKQGRRTTIDVSPLTQSVASFLRQLTPSSPPVSPGLGVFPPNPGESGGVRLLAEAKPKAAGENLAFSFFFRTPSDEPSEHGEADQGTQGAAVADSDNITSLVPLKMGGVPLANSLENGEMVLPDAPETWGTPAWRERTEYLRQCCKAIDAWDDSGELHQRTSPFQRRRAEQVRLLQVVWAHFFYFHPILQEDAARRLLAQRFNSADEVFGVIEVCVTYPDAQNNPFSYVMKTIAERQREERDGVKMPNRRAAG